MTGRPHRAIGAVLASAAACLCVFEGASLDAEEATSAVKTDAGRNIEESGETVKLGEIVVTAPRTGVDGRQVIGPASAAAESMSKTVEGLLEGFSGIDLGRRAFSGNQSSRISIRGFDESRSLIMMDGRSLHGAGVYGGYYVDWASLSLEDVQSVELIRGMAPAMYGNTLGGVVNIVTAEGRDESDTKLRFGGGSLGTWDAQARYSGAAGSTTYSFAAGRFETDGCLRNAFFERNMLSARIGFLLPADIKLSAGARYTDNEAGMIVYNMPDAWSYDPGKPDSLGAQLGGPFIAFRENQWGRLDWGDGTYSMDRRLNVDLGLSRKSDNLNCSFRAYLMDQDREEYFYAVDNPDRLVLRRDSEPEKNNWGWKADFESRLDAENAHVVNYGIDGSYLGYGASTIKSADPACFWQLPPDSPGRDDAVTTLHGVYVQDLWTLNESMQVQAGVRGDGYKADGPEYNAVTVDEFKAAPRLACIVTPWQGGRTSFRVGQAYRFPTNPEYYWWYSGYRPDGRKDLTSEKGTQFELELSQELGLGASVLARTYQYEVHDYIRTIFGYMPSRVVYNIDEVDFAGFEMEGGCDISPALRLSANFTHQETRKRGDVLDNSAGLSSRLAELPENKLNLKMSYGHNKGLKAEAKLGYVDKRWATMGDLTAAGGSYLAKMPGYCDVDVRVSYPVYHDNAGREVRLEIVGDNILDRDIVEEYGYPMPGATVMAGLRADF